MYLQFGFKLDLGLSCARAIFTLRIVNDYFNIVFIASLDASRAFLEVDHAHLLLHYDWFKAFL